MDNDFYGSTVTNNSGSSLLVMPLVPMQTSAQQQSNNSVIQQQQQNQINHPNHLPSSYEPIVSLPMVPQQSPPLPFSMHPSMISPSSKQTSPSHSLPQSNPISQQPIVQQLPPSGATVVRRSSRLSSKKTRSQRCTLAASQLAEAAHELTLALSASNHVLGNTSSGDTWPRYRPPNQLLELPELPSFYKHHGHELKQIYSKQGHTLGQQSGLSQHQHIR